MGVYKWDVSRHQLSKSSQSSNLGRDLQKTNDRWSLKDNVSSIETPRISRKPYVENRVTNIKSRFMRVLTQDHRLGFLAIDGHIIWGKLGWEILKILVKRQFQSWNVVLDAQAVVSSTYSLREESWTEKFRSLINTLNRRGPERMPWETPQYTSNQSETTPLTFVLCFRPDN